MVEYIISFTLRNRGMVLFFTAFLIVAGGWSLLRLPIDAFPDVTNNQVEIVSRAPGLSALEIERFVTAPVEMCMRGLPKVTQMRSVTKFGISIITLIFDENMDASFARQLVFERLSEARNAVPERVEVSLGPIATAMGEIYQYTLQGAIPTDSLQRIAFLTDLRMTEEWTLAPLLKSVAGVNEVNSFGGYIKQYQVIVSQERLLRFGVTIDDVYSSIEKNNQNVGGDILERNADQYIVRGVGLVTSIDDIGVIVLKSVKGMPVLMRDVAEVRIGEGVRQGAAMVDGKEECVGGIVMMLRGENGREVVRRVEDKVREINAGAFLPKGVRIVPYYDRSGIVNRSIGTVTWALLEGAAFVLIILFLFLRSIRGSIVVLIALPLSLLITFVVMELAGISANLMSLGGLAISLGMIIDATIIQVENVQRHLHDDNGEKNLREIISLAVLEVRKPGIFGELIIAITFIPILSLEGIEGKMFAPLAETVAIALFASLFLSIFVIPVLCSLFLNVKHEGESAVMERLRHGYETLIRRVIAGRKLVIFVAVVLLIAALALIPCLGTEFIPIMDEGAFDMDVQLLPGISLGKALEVNALIATKLKAFPELGTIVGRTGQTGVALDTRGVDKTGYVGVLKPRSEWRRNISREELTDEMRAALSSIPGISFGFSQPIQCKIDELVAGTRAQLIVRIFGDDLGVLKTKADEIAKELSRMEGITDLAAEKTSGLPYLTISIDRMKIARYGLNVSDVQKVIQIAIGGMPASKLYDENRSFDITVRLPEEKRNSVETIGNILVASPGGAEVPLGQIAQVRISEGPVQISREDGMRRIGIEMNVSNRDIGSFVSEAKERIGRKMTLPAGYFISWGGQFQNQQRAMNKLLVIAPVAISLILLLLFVSFRSLKLSLLVFLNLPFALIGGVFSLYLSGLYLSVPASIGFIVLFGVAILNGLVLVSRISQLCSADLDTMDAVIRGSLDRLRPVLMTALISIFSLLPMLVSSGAGSEIQKPLAVVVCGGLVSSTLLTLVLLPAIYPGMKNIKVKSEG